MSHVQAVPGEHKSMKKKDLIAALSSFNDDDHIMIDSSATTFVPEIQVICGGRQKYMAYYCVLSPGHKGDCYCRNKNVNFRKEL